MFWDINFKYWSCLTMGWCFIVLSWLTKVLRLRSLLLSLLCSISGEKVPFLNFDNIFSIKYILMYFNKVYCTDQIQIIHFSLWELWGVPQSFKKFWHTLLHFYVATCHTYLGLFWFVLILVGSLILFFVFWSLIFYSV